MLRIVETFRSVSPFAASLNQEVRNPGGENRDIDLGQKNSKPLSPIGTGLKPPKHPRSLSASMTGLKL